MGFLNGRVTYTRYRVTGDSPLPYSEDLLEQVALQAIGRRGGPDANDGVSVGWGAGDHLLDLTFDLAKNVVNDALHLAIRVDTDKIPGSLLKAYTRIETDARAATNPSGLPTKTQRTEAKEAARIRAEAEAADGRFRRLAHYPVLWDGRTDSLFVGATSVKVLERVRTLFRETFDRDLEPVTSGSLAQGLADARGDASGLVEGVDPVGFVGDDSSPFTVAWAGGDDNAKDFWGNEFLIWLWHKLQSDGDAVPLPDGSEVTVMLAKTLTLDCPRGETGRDQLTDEGPSRMPEAFRALQAGKLPRKTGLILVRHDQQYELTLQAETLAVSGANLPRLEGGAAHEIAWARVDALRHLVETLDLLYDAYGRRRVGPDWGQDLGRIRKWLQPAA